LTHRALPVTGTRIVATEAPPSWVLISVLFSSFPLEEGLALALHRVALELYRHGRGAGELEHGLAHGVVRNKNQDAAIGTLTGPVFEAELETERGQGEVRFLLTRQGLEALQVVAEHAPPLNARMYLN
jgi:hypothetical protein